MKKEDPKKGMISCSSVFKMSADMLENILLRTEGRIAEQQTNRYPKAELKRVAQEMCETGGDKRWTYSAKDTFQIGFVQGGIWQTRQSPWISVNDRLPEPDEEVLLYNDNSIRHYVTGWLRKNKGYNNSMWALSNGWVEDKDITHWMPIPKIKKE